MIRNKGLAKGRHPGEASKVLNRHDARQDRDGDPMLATLFDPIDKQTSVIEKLCDNEIRSLVHFVLEPFKVILFASRVQVSLGVTCYSN